MAGVAVEAGAGGLAFARVRSGCEIDAAKPLQEGLTPGQREALLTTCSAQEVRSWHYCPIFYILHDGNMLTGAIAACPPLLAHLSCHQGQEPT